MSDNSRLVNVLRLMGQNDKAINHFDEILKTLDSKKSPHHYAWCTGHQGEAHLQMGNLKEAQDNLEHAIKLNPQSAWTQAKLGEVLRMKGNEVSSLIDRWNNYAQAIVHFDEAINLDPSYAWALAHRGATFANARLKRYLGSVAYDDTNLTSENWSTPEKLIWIVKQLPGSINTDNLTKVGPRDLERNYIQSLAIQEEKGLSKK